MSDKTELPCTQARVLVQQIFEAMSMLMVRGDQAHILLDVRNKLAMVNRSLEEVASLEATNVRAALQAQKENGCAQNGATPD